MHITNGWLDEALDGSYGAKSSERGGYTPKWLVLHGTAGGSSAAGIDHWFTHGLVNGQPVQASAHVIIDQAGIVVQGINFNRVAWANCCTSVGHAPYFADGKFHNLHTISIEHVKAHDDNSDALTPIQAQKSFEVVACICDAYGIPKRPGNVNGGIISHADLDPVSRARCPGPYPWNELWAFLKNGGSTVKTYGPGYGDFDTYFTVSNGNWICRKFNTTLLGGNLGLYQKLSMDGNTLPILGLPRTNEIYQHEQDNYVWSVQFCERGLLVYDPAHRKDSQPGMEKSYIGKYEQFKQYDPAYQPGPVI